MSLDILRVTTRLLFNPQPRSTRELRPPSSHWAVAGTASQVVLGGGGGRQSRAEELRRSFGWVRANRRRSGLSGSRLDVPLLGKENVRLVAAADPSWRPSRVRLDRLSGIGLTVGPIQGAGGRWVEMGGRGGPWRPRLRMLRVYYGRPLMCCWVV